ncbi:LpqB family beta-propeller domain-containing protein [Streptomyces poonensis]|uniref:Lipoprotein LpqB n=1 Tax=Streptomyces poonensis TaxID=68255 RepID=A0A918UMP7_9ACTN|nr:LpqB family beta-propeller domain-containing protein [Streptomyces poonensis]GGZ21637.1 lipoprotein LpqB [Streptomyces poonensis]GLJ93466.1 lipoprotein LpqB [Streptomyces poonensis]
MGADREGRGRRRRVRVAACAGGAAVLLAGCASMPDSGDLRGVESTPRQDTQVRVFALPPRDDARPAEIVQGFLEALTSDDTDYETARKYLAGQALEDWRPSTSTTILAEGPNATPESSGTREDDGDLVYRLTGRRVARVDAQNAYAPADGSYSETVHLTRLEDSKQWRIDRLPQGVVLGKSDFRRTYVSVNKYYFTSSTQPGQMGTVADPVYVRRQVDPVTQMVRSLLKGPTRWLEPVARTSFPPGTALKKGVESLTPDDQNKLTVPLNGRADRAELGKCREMAAQLLFTLQDLTPTGVDEVELQRSDGTQLCELDEDRAGIVAAHGAGQGADFEYFIDGDDRLVRMSSRGGVESPEPVPGVLGAGDKSLRSAAVARDEDRAAGVLLDGSALYVGSLASGGSLGDPVVLSEGSTEGDRLTTPSWDGRNDLWVADRDPQNPRLLMLQDGAGEPVEVATPQLDGRIEAVRVAADGVRIALIVEKDDKRSLLIGRIERGDDRSGRTTVSIVGLRSVTPQLEEVRAMSWAGDSRLVVVGRESGGVQLMRYVQVDGSTLDGPELAALTGVQEIAASEDESLPLVAHSEDGIVRLSSGSQWQQVVEKGSAPVYPG